MEEIIFDELCEGWGEIDVYNDLPDIERGFKLISHNINVEEYDYSEIVW